jgi:ABC-type dipeptide/oligopeptide/nickel transport system permease component
MGRSIFQNQPVSEIIGGRLGATIELAVVALLLATIIGVTLGVIAAMRQGSLDRYRDHAARPARRLHAGLLAGLAADAAIRGAAGLAAVDWPRRPDCMKRSLTAVTGRPGVLWDSLTHIALPALALAANSAAIISRLVRASMLEVLREDFVRTAYAKGLRKGRVVVRHALRNALLPVLSVIGLRFGALLGGAVITESIFAWPGLGQLTIAAISQRDLPLIQGIVLTFAIVFALVNLVVDLLYAAVDPRIRLG